MEDEAGKTDPFANPPLTPRLAAERIFHSTNRLLRFVGLVDDSLHLTLDILEVARAERDKHGAAVDFGAFNHIVKEADAKGSAVLIECMDAGAYLHGLAAVRLMTALEAGMDGLVVELWKRNGAPQECGTNPGETTLRKKLRSLKRTSGAKNKDGIDQFEAVLETVGLGGEVNDDLRKAVSELAATRHVLVHKDGYPGQEFRKKYPDLPIFGAGVIRVSMIDLLKYIFAVLAYMTDILVRLQKKGWFDGDTDTDWAKQRDDTLLMLEQMAAKPRPKPSGTPDDLTFGFEAFETRRKERAKRHGNGIG